MGILKQSLRNPISCKILSDGKLCIDASYTVVFSDLLKSAIAGDESGIPKGLTVVAF